MKNESETVEVNVKLADIRRQNLAVWMDKSYMSNTDLANLLGVGRSYVSLLLNGSRSFGEKAARSIEQKMGIPEGYLDADGTKPQLVESWHKPKELQPGMYGLVPRMSVSIGRDGKLVHTDTNMPPLAFSRSWLEMKWVTSKDNLRIVEMKGDSMEPYLKDTDTVMVDCGQTLLRDGEIYAISHSGELRIKRMVKRFDGGVIIRSDNPKYPDESLSAEQAASLSIIGAVVYRAG